MKDVDFEQNFKSKTYKIMEWTSVKDKLPDELHKYCNVVVTFEDEFGDNGFITYVTQYKLTYGTDAKGDDIKYWEDVDGYIQDNVTHWMYLPEPPKI